MLKTVVQVFPQENYKVYVYFSDGQIRLFDMNQLIHSGGIFRKIKESSIFLNNCTVVNGTLGWFLGEHHSSENCIDIDPEVIYSEGEVVKDPLSEEKVS